MWPSVILALALLLLVVATYAPAVSGGFLMDDDTNLVANRTLYSVRGLRDMWLDPAAVQQYYPLVHTMFWVECRLWGFDPAGYHVVNILLHAGNVLLLWRLLSVLRVPGNWPAAAIFAVHPVEVESVAWVIERKNVLSMALALASMLCYLRFQPAETTPDGNDAPSAGRWPWYALALLLFAGAMFAKTAVVTLPAVLLVIYWWKRGRIGGQDVTRLTPFFVLGVSLALITVSQERNLRRRMGRTGRKHLQNANWSPAGPFGSMPPSCFGRIHSPFTIPVGRSTPAARRPTCSPGPPFP